MSFEDDFVVEVDENYGLGVSGDDLGDVTVKIEPAELRISSDPLAGAAAYAQRSDDLDALYGGLGEERNQKANFYSQPKPPSQPPPASQPERRASPGASQPPAGTYPSSSNAWAGNAAPSDSKDSGSSVYIANLQWWTTDQELETLCGEYGQVVSLKFIEERANGKSKGCALVEFAQADAATKCKETLHGKVINGRGCVVTFPSQGYPKGNAPGFSKPAPPFPPPGASGPPATGRPGMQANRGGRARNFGMDMAVNMAMAGLGMPPMPSMPPMPAMPPMPYMPMPPMGMPGLGMPGFPIPGMPFPGHMPGDEDERSRDKHRNKDGRDKRDFNDDYRERDRDRDYDRDREYKRHRH